MTKRVLFRHLHLTKTSLKPQHKYLLPVTVMERLLSHFLNSSVADYTFREISPAVEHLP